MSDVVRIELDRSSRVYQAGEEVSGTVVVEESVAREAHRILLRVWWETSGRGTPVRGGKRMAVLHEGAPRPRGSASEYRFRFAAPGAPFTYRGHLLSVEHVLQAVIVLADDTEESQGIFDVVPGDSVVQVPEALLEHSQQPSAKSRGSRRAAVFGAIAIGVGMVTLPFPGLLLFGVAILLLGTSVRQELAAARTGEVSVRVEPEVAAPGDSVDVRVTIKPPKPLPIQGVTVFLQARELCMSGPRENRKTHRYVLHSDEKEAWGETTLAGELNSDLSISFVVPRLDAWSFEAIDNEVRWEVGARVRLPRWPDWSGSAPLAVWPRAELPATGGGRPALPVAEGGRPELPAAGSSPKAIAPARATGSRTRDAASARPSPATPAATSAPSPAAPRPAAHGATRRSPAPEVTSHPPRKPPVADATPDTTGKTVEAPATPTVEAPGTFTPESLRPPREPPTVPVGSELATAVEEILGMRKYGSNREQRIEELIDSPIEVEVTIDRIDRPFGRTRIPGYEEGAVVKGCFGPDDFDVELHVPSDRRDLVDDLQRGDLLRVSGVVSSWERLPERPVIRVPIPATATGIRAEVDE